MARKGRLCRVSPINSSTLSSTTLTETVALWSATTSYTKGTQVRDDTLHKIFESITGGVTGTVTFDSAADTVTWTNHTLVAGDTVMFTTTGTMPGVTANTVYYVINPTGNTFQIANVPNGAPKDFTGSNTGTHTATKTPNYGNPVTDTDHWLLIGPTNPWAMFDDTSTTKSVASGTLTTVVIPDRFDTLALLGMTAVATVMVSLATTGTSRTNLARRSQELNDAVWTKTNLTVTADQIGSPYNLPTAEKLSETTANGEHYASASAASTVLANNFVQNSIYARAGTANWLVISTVDHAGTVRSSYFDLANGVVGTAASGHVISIEEAEPREASGVTGWYRCKVNAQQAGTNGNWAMRVGIASADGVKSYAGNTAENLYAWGAQIEVVAFSSTEPTPYIPTAGTSVTSSSYVHYQWTYDLTDTAFADSWYSLAGIYTETRYRPNLWIDDLPPYASATLTVTYTGSGSIGVGSQVHGLSRELGGIRYGAQPGLTIYRELQRDSNGNVTPVTRSYAPKFDGHLIIKAADCEDQAMKVDAVINLIAEYRDQAVLWDMTDEYNSLRVHGYLRDISPEIAYPHQTVLSISIDGLT